MVRTRSCICSREAIFLSNVRDIGVEPEVTDLLNNALAAPIYMATRVKYASLYRRAKDKPMPSKV